MEAKTSNTDQRVRKEISKSALAISRVYAANYQKEGTLTAEIKQTVTTKSYYPSKSVSNNMQDNPFSTSDFGFSENEYTSQETRVVWVDVPADSTVESVGAKLSSLPGATIYKVLANKPILSDNQIYAINAGLTTEDAIADKQVVRYPSGHPQENQLILDPNGKVQYKATFFKSSVKEDEDMRTELVSDFYATPAMNSELAGIITVQQETL
jgi:hypothetical protein